MCRYIQLPISAGMPEAWVQPWQELQDGSGGSVRQATAMEAAAEVRYVNLVGVAVLWGVAHACSTAPPLPLQSTLPLMSSCGPAVP